MRISDQLPRIVPERANLGQLGRGGLLAIQMYHLRTFGTTKAILTGLMPSQMSDPCRTTRDRGLDEAFEGFERIRFAWASPIDIVCVEAASE